MRLILSLTLLVGCVLSSVLSWQRACADEYYEMSRPIIPLLRDKRVSPLKPEDETKKEQAAKVPKSPDAFNFEAGSPSAMVFNMLNRHLSSKLTQAEREGDQKTYFTLDLQQFMASLTGEQLANFDADPVTGVQYSDKFLIRSVGVDPGAEAVVKVHFDDAGRDVEVDYLMQQENGVWKINDFLYHDHRIESFREVASKNYASNVSGKKAKESPTNGWGPSDVDAKPEEERSVYDELYDTLSEKPKWEIDADKCNVTATIDYDKYYERLPKFRDAWLNKDYTLEHNRHHARQILDIIVMRHMAAIMTYAVYNNAAEKLTRECHFTTGISYLDKFGQLQSFNAVRWAFDNDLAGKINWEKFDEGNFNEIAKDWVYTKGTDDFNRLEAPLSADGEYHPLHEEYTQTVQSIVLPSLFGIQLDENISKVKLPDATFLGESRMGHTNARKWRLANGNDLSVTYSSTAKRIVYVEADWNEKDDAVETGLPNLAFGKTTLGDLRRTFGSNGFAFANHAGAQTPDGALVAFNSYAFSSDENQVIVFTTRLSPEQTNGFRERKVALAAAVLVSVTLGDRRYLKKIWGSASLPDPAYKPIP